MNTTFKLDIETAGDGSIRGANGIEVVGHRSNGPVGLKRFALGTHDAVVLDLTDLQALRLIKDLTARLETRANTQRAEAWAADRAMVADMEDEGLL